MQRKIHNVHLINNNTSSVFEIIIGKDNISTGTFAEWPQELFFHDGNNLTGSSANEVRMLAYAMLRLSKSINFLGTYSVRHSVISSLFTEALTKYCIFNLGILLMCLLTTKWSGYSLFARHHVKSLGISSNPSKALSQDPF